MSNIAQDSSASIRDGWNFLPAGTAGADVDVIELGFRGRKRIAVIDFIAAKVHCVTCQDMVQHQRRQTCIGDDGLRILANMAKDDS